MAVALLAAGIVLLFVRPGRMPLWVGPIGAAIVGVATGVVRWPLAADALHLLRNPLPFPLFAVPLAWPLDRTGILARSAGRAGRDWG